MTTNSEPSPVAIMTIARDANASDRRAAAIRILIEEGGFCLAAALDELTPVRTPQVGDVLSCSWGYEQTRVDFYQVTKVTAKTVTVHEIAKRYVTHEGHGNATVMPVPGAFQSDEKPLANRRFGFCQDGCGESKWRYSIRVTSYSHAYLWHGEACGESGEH